ncbi:MAG: ribonuclease P protein component [Patescibacteria group bacterium]|nr:ribonuclease P protein component [Patescibacteria group bacterium]
MLSKKLRLNFSQDFPRLLKKGKKIYNPLFVVRYLSCDKNTILGFRAAIIVSKKVSASAAVRHQIKRRISEAVFLNRKKLSQNINMVFLVKKECVGKSFIEIKKEIEKNIALLTNSH